MRTRASKSITPKRKKKTYWTGVFITALTIVLFSGAFIWMGYNIYHHETEEQVAFEKHKKAFPIPGKVIQHKIVCMASNVYMGKDQLEVLVDGKTYYSCSPHCTAELLSRENVRMATDPFSNRIVNKAEAAISMSADSLGTILYFESEENLKRYLKN